MIRIKTSKGSEIVVATVGELIAELSKHLKDMAVLFTWEDVVREGVRPDADNPFSFITEEKWGDPPQNVVMVDCE